MPYYLDLLEHRNISNAIAQDTGVEHESPQAILIENGKVLKHASHMSIYVSELLEA
jgi:bacillithiol system protein YtxJ